MAIRPYDSVAAEYYDPRHITSRNFEQAASHHFDRNPCVLPQHGYVMDLGAGKGQLSRYFRVAADRIVQTDISGVMLALAPREASFARVQCDAARLPFRSGEFSAIGAFLCDPINSPTTWSEAHRVLHHGGVLVATLPHREWGNALRRCRGYAVECARFILNDGRSVDVGSALSSDDSLRQILSDSGFSSVIVSSACLPANVSPVSPDILDAAVSLGIESSKLPILTVVSAIRE